MKASHLIGFTLALAAAPAAADHGRHSKRPPKPPKATKTAKPEVAAPAPEPEAAKAAPKADTARPGDAARRESRIEFDERMVQGQTAAGAIYLFQRADAAFSSMITPPETFRERTVRTVYVDGVPGGANK